MGRSQPRDARDASWASCLVAAALAAAAGCDARIIEAVGLGSDGNAPGGGKQEDTGTDVGPAEGGPAEGGALEAGPLEGGPPEGGAPVDREPPEAGPPLDVAFETGGGFDASCVADASSPTFWPNCISSANSDPWLAAHHDALTVLRPRLLILHFLNGSDVAQIETGAQTEIRALREGSRYHGYAQANAPAFLDYQIVKTVDLTDHPVPPPGTWDFPSSTQLPVTPAGDFDTAALFTQKFADNMGAQGFLDPSSSRNLTLCEIFERGLVNEAWLVAGEGGRRRPPLMLERKQAYDTAGNPVAGSFLCIKGGTCVSEINCRTTVRMAHLDLNRGPGCDIEVRGWNIENMRGAIPYLDTNLRAFFNADFRSRFGATFDSFDEICDKSNTQCVSYPTPTQASGTRNGVTWTINPFMQGCGTPEFPPNARWRYDWSNKGTVQSRCEHYGMRDGSGGQDLPDVYTFDKVAAYEAAFGKPDCGTGWQIYWRQSLPGLQTTALDADGKRMKNFWPFLFY